MLSVMIPLYILIITNWSLFKNNKKTFIFTLYGLASLIVLYPIADEIHFTIGIVPSVIGIMYFVYIVIYKIIKKINKNKIFLSLK